MSFEKLIEDLDALQKACAAKPPVKADAQPRAKADEEDDIDDIETGTEVGNDKIMDAAGDATTPEMAEMDAKAPPPPKKRKPQEENEEEDAIEPLGKAFAVTLEDGSEVEAYDATLVLKSFDDRMNNLDLWMAQRSDTIEQIDEDIQTLRKSYDADKAAIEKVIQAQNDLIKSLAGQMESLSVTPRDRKSVLSVHERPIARTEVTTPNIDNLMTKAMNAQRNGRLTSFDIARLETYTARGMPPPVDILKVIQN